MSTALLVLGMQYDFCPGGVSESEHDILEAVNTLILQAEHVFVCQDFRQVALRQVFEDPWALEEHGMREAGGAMLLPGLLLDKDTTFVHTGVRSASTNALDGYVYNSMKNFYKKDYGADDLLSSILRQKDIGDLTLCGVLMEHLRETALAGVGAGFRIVVDGRACGGPARDVVLKEIVSAGILVKGEGDDFGSDGT